ncbi:hypothetical protein Hanom_Chr09g00797431 [Helianthus anomalus]
MPKERKYKRPLAFLTRHPDESLGDILSWGYLEDLKVYAIKREYDVQYFNYLKRYQDASMVGCGRVSSDEVDPVRYIEGRTFP